MMCKAKPVIAVIASGLFYALYSIFGNIGLKKYILFKEPANIMKIIGIVFILASIIILNIQPAKLSWKK